MCSEIPFKLFQSFSLKAGKFKQEIRSKGLSAEICSTKEPFSRSKDKVSEETGLRSVTGKNGFSSFLKKAWIEVPFSVFQ
jgi:hypothetical protein